MAQKEYGKLEAHIINTFIKSKRFECQGKEYIVEIADKPRPQGNGGECKTDVFILAKEKKTNNRREIKISVKNDNKEFIGNKLTKKDVESYFGPEWEDIVIKTTKSLKEEFENRVLIFASGKHPTKENSVTVGWKLEISDRPRTLSAKIPLSDQEIRNYVYKGTNMSEDKKNSIVDNKIIKNSGVAEYLLITNKDEIKTANDVIDKMESIDNANIGETYFIFTANNYRTDVDKADGKRSLAVRIEWHDKNNKMVPVYYYDKPLSFTGEGDMAQYVKEALSSLGKKNASELKPGIDVDKKIFME